MGTYLVHILGVGPVSAVVWRPHGKLRAKSAKVSLRWSCFCCFFAPPHSRRMSVSWANEERLRRPPAGGELSCVSVGGEMEHIWVAESRRPPKRCRIVDSSSCKRRNRLHFTLKINAILQPSGSVGYSSKCVLQPDSGGFIGVWVDFARGTIAVKCSANGFENWHGSTILEFCEKFLKHW